MGQDPKTVVSAADTCVEKLALPRASASAETVSSADLCVSQKFSFCAASCVRVFAEVQTQIGKSAFYEAFVFGG
jgi:hypothetical protein